MSQNKTMTVKELQQHLNHYDGDDLVAVRLAFSDKKLNHGFDIDACIEGFTAVKLSEEEKEFMRRQDGLNPTTDTLVRLETEYFTIGEH